MKAFGVLVVALITTQAMAVSPKSVRRFARPVQKNCMNLEKKAAEKAAALLVGRTGEDIALLHESYEVIPKMVPVEEVEVREVGKSFQIFLNGNPVDVSTVYYNKNASLFLNLGYDQKICFNPVVAKKTMSKFMILSVAEVDVNPDELSSTSGIN